MSLSPGIPCREGSSHYTKWRALHRGTPSYVTCLACLEIWTTTGKYVDRLLDYIEPTLKKNAL